MHRHLDGKAPWKYLALLPECRPAARVTSRTAVAPFPRSRLVRAGSARRAQLRGQGPSCLPSRRARPERPAMAGVAAPSTGRKAEPRGTAGG